MNGDFDLSPKSDLRRHITFTRKFKYKYCLTALSTV